MNIKIKIALIIIITLALGIVIGAMLNRALLQRRINRVFSWRSPDFMINNFENIIEPDQEQRKLIREILNRHAKRMMEYRENHQKELQESFESLQRELDLILTPEQKRRLQRRLSGPFQRFRGFPGKPPFKPPREKKPPKEPKR